LLQVEGLGRLSWKNAEDNGEMAWTGGKEENAAKVLIIVLFPVGVRKSLHFSVL